MTGLPCGPFLANFSPMGFSPDAGDLHYNRCVRYCSLCWIIMELLLVAMLCEDGSMKSVDHLGLRTTQATHQEPPTLASFCTLLSRTSEADCAEERIKRPFHAYTAPVQSTLYCPAGWMAD